MHPECCNQNFLIAVLFFAGSFFRYPFTSSYPKSSKTSELRHGLFPLDPGDVAGIEHVADTRQGDLTDLAVELHDRDGGEIGTEDGEEEGEGDARDVGDQRGGRSRMAEHGDGAAIFLRDPVVIPLAPEPEEGKPDVAALTDRSRVGGDGVVSESGILGKIGAKQGFSVSKEIV